MDIKELFSQYRIFWDPSYKKTINPDPCMMQLKCAYGWIYPYNDKLLSIEVDYHPKVTKKLQKLKLQLIQDGDDEKTFLCPIEVFDKIASIMKPHKKRAFTEEHKLKSKEILQKLVS